MKQALMNIFSNCIRHGRKVICVNVVENSNKLEITISDDGEGFTEDDLQNLFNRFSMGKKGESGLGLSITKSIIDKHQGT